MSSIATGFSERTTHSPISPEASAPRPHARDKTYNFPKGNIDCRAVLVKAFTDIKEDATQQAYLQAQPEAVKNMHAAIREVATSEARYSGFYQEVDVWRWAASLVAGGLDALIKHASIPYEACAAEAVAIWKSAADDDEAARNAFCERHPEFAPLRQILDDLSAHKITLETNKRILHPIFAVLAAEGSLESLRTCIEFMTSPKRSKAAPDIVLKSRALSDAEQQRKTTKADDVWVGPRAPRKNARASTQAQRPTPSVALNQPEAATMRSRPRKRARTSAPVTFPNLNRASVPQPHATTATAQTRSTTAPESVERVRSVSPGQVELPSGLISLSASLPAGTVLLPEGALLHGNTIILPPFQTLPGNSFLLPNGQITGPAGNLLGVSSGILQSDGRTVRPLGGRTQGADLPRA